MAVGFLYQPGEHRHGRALVGRIEELARVEARIGNECRRHVHPATVPVLVEPADDVHRLQRQSELAPERHHPLTRVPRTREPQREQLGEEMAHASGHLVHVVVQVGLGLEARSALRPARHPGTRLAHAADEDFPRGRCQPFESIEDGRRVPGHERVRSVLPGIPQALDQRLWLPAPCEDVLPLPQQRYLLVAAKFAVVFQVVGNPQQEIRHGHFRPQGLGKDPDPHREGAAGGDEKFLERGHGGLSAPRSGASTPLSAARFVHRSLPTRWSED